MKKALKYSVVRFLIGLLLVGVPYFLVMGLGNGYIEHLKLSTWQDRLTNTLFDIALGLLAFFLYKVYFKFIEQKPFFEFSTESLFADLKNGFIYTSIIAGILLSILYLMGNIKISAGSGLGYLPVAIASALMAATAEEILFRGLMFRLCEEKLGSYLAIAISSLLFGLAHYVNPGASLLSALAIGLEAGIALSATYMLTRKLWLNISIHFTWNLIAGILGFHYMAAKSEGGVFDTTFSGSKLLTGGEFGIEFSILMVLAGVFIGFYLLMIARKKGLIIPPFWGK